MTIVQLVAGLALFIGLFFLFIGFDSRNDMFGGQYATFAMAIFLAGLLVLKLGETDDK